MNSEKIIAYIEEWLLQYLTSAHQKGFIIGISGGIDSAVVSTLCARTGQPLLCLEMPIHQKANEVSRAHQHIHWLKENFTNVSSLEIDLTDVFDRFSDAVDISGNNEIVNLSLANTRARLRMTTLYYYAAINRYLVAGTGNKIEDFGIGFFTKYGDGGVDISPIGDLVKSEVRALGKALGVSEAIIAAHPTDGLFEDSRSDEDQIGASYDELEWAMNVVDNQLPTNHLSDREKEVLDIYLKRHRANLHKINPIPICKIPEELK